MLKSSGAAIERNAEWSAVVRRDLWGLDLEWAAEHDGVTKGASLLGRARIGRHSRLVEWEGEPLNDSAMNIILRTMWQVQADFTCIQCEWVGCGERAWLVQLHPVETVLRTDGLDEHRRILGEPFGLSEGLVLERIGDGNLPYLKVITFWLRLWLNAFPRALQLLKIPSFLLPVEPLVACNGGIYAKAEFSTQLTQLISLMLQVTTHLGPFGKCWQMEHLVRNIWVEARKAETLERLVACSLALRWVEPWLPVSEKELPTVSPSAELALARDQVPEHLGHRGEYDLEPGTIRYGALPKQPSLPKLPPERIHRALSAWLRDQFTIITWRIAQLGSKWEASSVVIDDVSFRKNLLVRFGRKGETDQATGQWVYSKGALLVFWQSSQVQTIYCCLLRRGQVRIILGFVAIVSPRGGTCLSAFVCLQLRFPLGA